MVKNKITQNQYMFIVFSAMIGVGVLTMAFDLCKSAKQNGWIPISIGGLYPIFILITASIIDNKTDHASFWDYSNKIYGKKLSYVFAFIFLAYFLTIFAGVSAGFSHILTLSIMPFFKPMTIIIPCLILVTFISLSGLQMVGRISELYFYITLPLLLVAIFLIPTGSITNIKPIYFSLSEMSKTIPSTSYYFAGCEVGYFIISRISNNKNTKKAGIIASLIITFVYFINVIIVIYNLGWELTSRIEAPLLYLIQSIEIPIISNFLSIVIFFWSAIALRLLLIYDFISSEILSKVIKIDYKKANFIILAIVCIYAFFMTPEYNRKMIVNATMPYFVLFSIIWSLTTVILVSVKYRSSKE